MPMRNRSLLVFLLVLGVAPLASAQGNKEKVLCAESNMGSAIGAGECWSYRVKAAEKKWRELVEKQAKARAAQSDSHEWMYEIVKTEAKSWRAHLKDKCLLDSAGTAGMVQWDYVYALDCQAQGLLARIQEIRKIVDVQPK